jgi:hypothetical protein
MTGTTPTLDFHRMNIPGVVAGVLTLILPFLGAWWSLTLGTDAMVVTTSPFEAKTIIFGNYIASPLFEWFCLEKTPLARSDLCCGIGNLRLAAEPDIIHPSSPDRYSIPLSRLDEVLER